MKINKDLVYLACDSEQDKEITKFLTEQGKLRQLIKSESNINIEGRADIVVCNSSLTKVAGYLQDKNNTIDTLVIFGGFVGTNVLKNKVIPDGFKGKTEVKDKNLSADIDATIAVLSTDQVKKIYMLCQNVTSSASTSELQQEILNLTCKGCTPSFKYLGLNPCYNKESDTWGSGIYLMYQFKEGRMRLVYSAIGTN